MCSVLMKDLGRQSLRERICYKEFVLYKYLHIYNILLITRNLMLIYFDLVELLLLLEYNIANLL